MSLPIPKLPLPTPASSSGSATGIGAEVEQFSREVVLENLRNVRGSSAYIRRAYNTLYCMYVGLFCIGTATAVVAIVKGFLVQSTADAVGSVAIAGLSAASFFALFLTRPLESLERNSVYSAWLTAVANSYWTRLMYFSDPQTIEHDLTQATDDLVTQLTILADKHTAAINKD